MNKSTKKFSHKKESTLKKTLILGLFLVVLLGISGISGQAVAQEVALDECYGGVATTSFAVYDPDIGEYVEIRFRCLPWWWDPLYLPFGWVFLSPAIVPMIWYEANCVGGVISFSAFHYREGYRDRFRRFHGHFGNFRGHLQGKFDRHFKLGMRKAHEKFPGLKKPPDFQHTVKGHKGTDKFGGHHGIKQDHTPGKSAPPAGKFIPPSAKAGPPPPKGSSLPPSATTGQKLPPPAKSTTLPSGRTSSGAPKTYKGKLPAAGKTSGMGTPRSGVIQQSPRVSVPKSSVGSGKSGSGGSKAQPPKKVN